MRTARIPLEGARATGPLEALGSPRLTLALLPLLAVGVVLASRDAGPPSSILAAPLGALAVNLAAAIATRAAFRAQPALLAFHVALLAVVTLAAVGRLTYLKGRVELSEGEAFAGRLHWEESGPLHPRALERIAFENRGFTVDYEPMLRRGRTENRLAVPGRLREVTIGDDAPLAIDGYRFYTSSNKGFAPELAWSPADGSAPLRGTVHLPSFPLRLERQEADWEAPGRAAPIHLVLEIDEPLVQMESRWRLRTPRSQHLALRSGADAAQLRPGESWSLPEGTLQYAGLRTWMGYTVSYDPTLPWMLASALLAAIALGAHFAQRFRAKPWDAPAPGGPR